MKQEDLKVAPDSLFPTERVRDFKEWSLLRNWMKDWLRYVVANSPSLSDFFSAPEEESAIIAYIGTKCLYWSSPEDRSREGTSGQRL